MLKNKVSIIVPSQTSYGTIFNRESEVINTMTKLSFLFGGASAIEQKGAWLDDEGNLHTEENTLVYSFCEALTMDSLEKLFQYASDMRIRLHQYCISLEVNGCLMFIDEKTVLQDVTSVLNTNKEVL